MTDISYDAKKNSKPLTEFSEGGGGTSKDDDVDERVDEEIVDAVVDATRRTTVQGLSVREIHSALQGSDDVQPSQDEVMEAVEYLKEKEWLRETGFTDEEADAQDGLPRFTNRHFWKQTQQTREELLENGGDE